MDGTSANPFGWTGTTQLVQHLAEEQAGRRTYSTTGAINGCRLVQSQPTNPAFVGVAGLAGTGDIAMLVVAANVGSEATQTAYFVHCVIVKVVPLPEQAHPAMVFVGLLVQLGGEHDVDSHVPEPLPQVEIS